MSIKPCAHEQDVLYCMHGEATPFQRVRLWLHLLFCDSCRRRQQEFDLTSRALNALRPGFATPRLAVAVPPRRRTRLILCSAAVAIAAAALSYYFTFVATQPQAILESEPNAGAALPPPEEDCIAAAPIPEEKKAQMKRYKLKKAEAAVPPKS